MTANTNNPLSKFVFDADDGAQQVVRSITIDGEPWFVAADVCAVLEVQNTTDALSRLDDDEKARLNLGLPGGDTNIINESGLYSLTLGSRKPQAKRFKKWVTGDVLPSIRKTGAYVGPDAQLGASSIGNPPFLSHGADIMVAADRTFRSAIRSGRSLGLNHAQAVLHANRITIERTGINLLHELQAQEHVQQMQAAAASHAAKANGGPWREGDEGILRFWAEYEGGAIFAGHSLPTLSLVLFAFYRHWCKRCRLQPVHLPRFVNVLVRRGLVRSCKKRYLTADGGMNGPASFLIPGGLLHVPDEVAEVRYLGECVAAAQATLHRYQAKP